MTTRDKFSRSLAFIIVCCGMSTCPAQGQDASVPGPMRWGPVNAHLQLGWELPRSQYHVGEPIVITVRLRAPDPDSPPVKVMSTGTLDLLMVTVLFGPKRRPVSMTKAGLDVIDPSRSMGGKGAYMDNRMIMQPEILVSEWWDVSRPGRYTVSISHRQRLPGNEQYAIVRAPDVEFQILRK